jgi:hypothetical protein
MPDLTPTALAATLSRGFHGLAERLGLHLVVVPSEAGDESVHRHPCEGRADRLAAEYARAGLPESLLRACDAEPLEVDDPRFVGREKEQARLLRCLDAWREQQPAMMAVVGPQGCGVTSLLRRLEAELRPGESLIYHALEGRPASARDALLQCGALFGLEEAPASFEQLVGAINALEPRMIVLDNGHYLACRIMGANETIRTLGALMAATQERHQWVLGCRDEAWRRLAYTHRADRFFTEVIELSPFVGEELGALMGARFAAAGFALAPSDTPTAGDGEEGDAEDPPPLPADRLAQLHALSGGLPAPAFCHLLRALEHGETGWRLGDFVPFGYDALKALDRMESFTLAEIAVHGALTTAEHLGLLRLPEQESQMLLQRLCAQGLLERIHRDGGDTRYRLVPTHVATIVARLHNANYLY